MNVNELKNLFILHPGGTGGNHLANLISLIPIFEPRLEKFEGDYQQEFLKLYERFVNTEFLHHHPTQVHTMKAHFLTNHGLNGLDDKTHRQQLLSNKRINILTGHWHCFDTSNLSDFTNHAWLIMSFPKEGSLAYKRIRVYDFWPQKKFLYNSPYLFNHPVINNDNSVEIDTDMFFQDSGSEYLRQLLKQHYGLELPAVADEMHSKWIYGLKKLLELFPDIK
jgi:hypothetical protein